MVFCINFMFQTPTNLEINFRLTSGSLHVCLTRFGGIMAGTYIASCLLSSRAQFSSDSLQNWKRAGSMVFWALKIFTATSDSIYGLFHWTLKIAFLRSGSLSTDFAWTLFAHCVRLHVQSWIPQKDRSGCFLSDDTTRTAVTAPGTFDIVSVF